MKRKILFVNGHLNVGGVENSLLNVLKNMDYDKYEVDLILFEDLGDYAIEVPKEVKIIYYDLNKAYGPIRQCFLDNIKEGNWFAILLRFIFLFEKIIGVRALSLSKSIFRLRTVYDCAIAYRIGICTDFVGYVIDSPNKITWWHHGTYDIFGKQNKRWLKVLAKFDRLIAVSESCKDMLSKNIPGIHQKIHTIPNIIDVGEIRRKALDETISENNEGITLLSIGRLSPEKGMINCVYACRRLVEAGFKVKWYLIGEGQERNEIESGIKENKLENNVKLLGALSNPYPYINNADIYVHPSLVESMSITVLESLALNTPVVVARSMGPSEFLRNKENGLLVEPTSDGLFEGIVALITNETLFSKLKEDKSDVLNNYTSEVIMKKIYGLFEAG